MQIKSSNKKIVQEIVASMLKYGVRHVVCSPGSRNSPLVIAFDEHPDITTYVFHDERVAGFVALGMIQELNLPVAVVCTSGSAVVNYFPAVTEAFYRSFPLLVISADRPSKWINQGDGQTIMQQHVFGKHVGGFLHVEETPSKEVVDDLEVLFQRLLEPAKLPLHLNVALDEPLYQTTMVDYQQPIPSEAIPPACLNANEIQRVKSAGCFSKILVLVGQMQPKSGVERLLSALTDFSQIAVLQENTSNHDLPKASSCIDRTLARIEEEEKQDFAPSLLITLGGAVVSKRIKSYFREYKPQEHWKVGVDFPEMNTYECLTHSFAVSESEFLTHLLETLNESEQLVDNYGGKWKQRDLEANDLAQNFIATASFSDLKVFDILLDYIPHDSVLHLANSSVVRYSQLFNPIQRVHYYSNRGTSGIDGSTSTAVGAALASPQKMHVLITGDVSFFYDSNALWNTYKIPNLRIFLINNDGGDIFNIIPGPSSTAQKDTYFVAKHGFSAEHIAAGLGVEYFYANFEEDLVSKSTDFYLYEEFGGIKLMEIDTRGCPNHQILNDYFDFIKKR